MDQRGEHMEINFEYFQVQKWMLEKELKKYKKTCGHLSSSHVSFLSYGP